MSMFTPKKPAPPAAAPPAPDRSTAEIQAMADEQRKRFGGAQGRASTALSGGLGVPQSDFQSAAVQLLGGASKV